MALNEKKGLAIAGIGSVLVAVTTILANMTEVWDNTKNTPNPTEPTIIAEETQNQDDQNTTEPQQNIGEEVPAPETQAPTEPAATEPPITYLDSLKITESSYFESRGSATDSIGNTYAGHVLFFEYSGYAIYYLGGKYITLSGTIAVSDDSRDNQAGQIAILTDDNQIYNTEVMERVSVPVEFSDVSVENCQWLKITNSGDAGARFILSDWKLQ